MRSKIRACRRKATVFFYVSARLTRLIPRLAGQSGTVTDAARRVWQIQDLRQTAVVVMLFTMAFISLLATLRLAGDGR